MQAKKLASRLLTIWASMHTEDSISLEKIDWSCYIKNYVSIIKKSSNVQFQKNSILPQRREWNFLKVGCGGGGKSARLIN